MHTRVLYPRLEVYSILRRKNSSVYLVEAASLRKPVHPGFTNFFAELILPSKESLRQHLQSWSRPMSDGPRLVGRC